MTTITVHSYKGGSGKTTIATQIAQKSEQNERVLLVESDFLMPSFQKIFPQISPNVFFNDYMDRPTEIALQDLIVWKSSKLGIISANPEFGYGDAYLTREKAWYLERLRFLQSDLPKLRTELSIDKIIIDTPPGWHFGVVVNLMLSDVVISVLRPDQPSIDGTKKLVEEIYVKAKPRKYLKILLLMNQVPRLGLENEVERWSDLLRSLEGVKWLGLIPASCRVSAMIAQGKYELANASTNFQNAVDTLYSKLS